MPESQRREERQKTIGDLKTSKAGLEAALAGDPDNEELKKADSLRSLESRKNAGLNAGKRLKPK